MVLGRELARWRAELVQDLGGAEALSTQQAAIVDLAVRGKMLLDSLDSWLLQQPALIDKRKRQLYPVVMQRQSLADGLLRHLTALGLQRVDKRVSELREYLRQHGSTKSQ